MVRRSSRPSVLRVFSIASALSLVVVAAGLTAARVARASAQTFNVNTTADGNQGVGTTCGSPAAGGACTLRAAIDLADRGSDDTISVPAGTYDLDPSLSFLNVFASMTITGAGSGTTIVDGGKATTILVVSAGSTVSISGLTVRDGFTNSFAAGADIGNDGTLTLTDVAVTGGDAEHSLGGGIASDGPLTLSDVVISGNHAGDGGGLALLGSVKTTITGSTISGNSADGLLVRDRDFNEFHLAGHGGGILVAGGAGTLPTVAISGSAISGNAAGGRFSISPGDTTQGGGIFNFAGVLSLANDTVAGNSATRDAGSPNPPAVGGGIVQTDVGATGPASFARTNAPQAHLSVLVPRFQAAEGAGFIRPSTAAPPSAASTTLDFVTLAGNSAEQLGGVASLAGKFTVANSIVSGNRAGNCGTTGAVTSSGYNVESANDCGFKRVGDQTGVDPKLDSLKLNPPGVTATMALRPGSPAIDAADPQCNQASPHITDQRGVTRPQGPRCDVGAFEVEQATTSTTPVPSPPVTGMSAVATWGRYPARAGVLTALVVVALLGTGVALRRRRPFRA